MITDVTPTSKDEPRSGSLDALLADCKRRVDDAWLKWWIASITFNFSDARRLESEFWSEVARYEAAKSANTSMSDPERATDASKVANPKDSLDAPVVLGMGSKTILPEGH